MPAPAPVAAPAPAPVAAPAAAKSAAGCDTLPSISADMVGCSECELADKRTQIVFGTGDPGADLIFIGEAPGADEDRVGEPFVGRAGQLLDKILDAAGFTRRDVYITNIVKCRPPGNRDPKPDEVISCNEYLLRQISAIEPKIICALGRFAAQTLLKKYDGIGKLRGRWFDWNGMKLICTYHPSACLRNEDLKRPVWNDIKMLRDAYREIHPV